MQPSLVWEGYMRPDDIDIELLKRCQENPGSPLAEIFEPFLIKLSERALYNRLFQLEAHRFICVDRASRRGRALASLTELGEKTISEAGLGRARPACVAGGSL
ncbi:MAG: hypothetical protein A4E48_00262 [Methanosaeta sp. PtaU1.Bin060]|nr:MAG: hypothetical protein A4E48_00262 [Methanosaeta sp. PtaU1.Bin060]